LILAKLASPPPCGLQRIRWCRTSPDDCTADVFNRQLKIRSELYAIATELDPT
jgi:hypothetical protein